MLLAMIAQAMRAILLARATATSLKGFFDSRPRAQFARACPGLACLHPVERGVRPDHQQLAQVPVAHFGDSAQPRFTTG